MRLRQSDVSAPAVSVTINGARSDGGSAYPLSAVSSYIPSRVQKTTWDVVIPDFHRRKSNGEVFNNPFESHVVSLFPQAPALYERYAYYGEGEPWERWSGQWSNGILDNRLMPVFDSTDDLARLSALAVTSAHANRSSVEQNALMMLGEGRKTVESLAGILVRVIGIVKAARKADLKYLRNELSLKELTDRYMELRYAIRPLVYDAVGVVSAWNAVTGSFRNTIRGATVETYTDSDTFLITEAGNRELTVRRVNSVEISCHAGILASIDVSHLSLWGFDQVAQTALEFVPFSFIAGWFFNLSSWVSAWAPSAGVTKLASWVTSQVTVMRSVEITAVRSLLPGEISPSYLRWEGISSEHAVHRIRTVEPSLESWPRMSVNLDTLKILDLALILKSFIR